MIYFQMSFRVTTEKKFDDQSAFLTECSVHKYLSGNYSRVPYLMGFTSNEAKPFFPRKKLFLIQKVKIY